MRFGRTIRATVAALAVAAAVFVPALPAAAADPAPVIPLGDTGSKLGWGSLGASDDLFSAYVKSYAAVVQAMRGQGAPLAAAIAEANRVVPKPAVIPTAITRGGPAGGAGVGAVLTAGMVGWGIGAHGTLGIIAAVQGTSYENVACSQPDWYQGVTSFVSFGIAPDCRALVTTINGDVSSTGLTDAVVGASRLSLQGVSTSTNPSIGPYYWCYSLTGGIPAGHVVVRWDKTSSTWSSGGLGSGYTAACPDRYTSRNPTGVSSQGYGPSEAPRFGFRETTSGTVVGQTVPVVNPTRTLSCRVRWSNGSTTTGAGSSYRESEGLPLSLAGTGCGTAWDARPNGTIPEKISIDSDNGGSIGTINEQTIPPSMMPSAPGDGSGLQLHKVVGTTMTSCMTWAANCADWWGETDSGQTPGVYRCTFGGAAVALDECGPYRYTFDAPTSTPTITNPQTGTTTQWSSSPSPGNSTNPGTGPGTGQWPADQCFAEGWSGVQNPVDWVLVPIKCALVWAFVPRTATLQAVGTQVSTAWAGTMPGQLPGIVTTAFVIPDAPSGCRGPLVDLPINLGATNKSIQFYPLDACSGVGATLAGMSTLISSLILIWATGLGIVRRASATVNAPGVGS